MRNCEPPMSTEVSPALGGRLPTFLRLANDPCALLLCGSQDSPSPTWSFLCVPIRADTDAQHPLDAFAPAGWARSTDHCVGQPLPTPKSWAFTTDKEHRMQTKNSWGNLEGFFFTTFILKKKNFFWGEGRTVHGPVHRRKPKADLWESALLPPCRSHKWKLGWRAYLM